MGLLDTGGFDLHSKRIPRSDQRLINDLRPTIWVGKNGLTQSIIKELRNQLGQREYVKVRSLLTHLPPDERGRLFEELGQGADAGVVMQQGHVAVYSAAGNTSSSP
ncbi:MAG TPA: YhbY family RNA-binding protein [Candidatus Poseidoniales archaeon]|nr:YhbY family RNA-binding protein [Candidatus Poseidoniales archaeon]